MKKYRFATLLGLVLVTNAFAADEPDEFVISTARNDKTVIPGASLKRPADFLLQQIRISNDTLEEKARKEEILETLRLMSSAAKDKGLELALLADYRTVVPLKVEVAALKMTRGNRADTSELIVCVKTKVVPGASNAAALFAKLKGFPKSIKAPGRSALDTVGDIELTIVNPAQYREPVVKLYAADSKLVTASLGPEYRVVTKGIDRQLQWLKDGLVDVILFIPYEYDVIPSNVTSYSR
jgi:hypothetical protein